MNHILFAIIVGGLTSLHVPALKRGNSPELTAERKRWAKKFAVFVAISALVSYFGLCALPLTYWGTITYFLLTGLLWLNFIWKGGGSPVMAQLLIAASMWLVDCTSVATNKSMEKAYLIGRVEKVNWSKTPPPLPLSDTPIVSQEQAVSRGARLAHETFGDRYALGSFTLQKVNGAPVWVAPLDFKNYKESLFGDFIPAVIVVDALSPTAAARVVSHSANNTAVQLVYTPRAFFAKGLLRHINNAEYFSFLVKDTHLELDDSMKPWWIVSGYTIVEDKTFATSGKIILIDPKTGDMKMLTPDAVPSWVDKAFGASDATEKLTQWGTCGSGLGSALVGSAQIITPSTVNDAAVWTVFGSDGRSYYYSALRPYNVRADHLVTLTLSDTRSGKTIEFPVDGTQGITPSIALERVAKTGTIREGSSATTPFLCSIDRRPVYVVPIVSAEGVVAKIALVDALSESVAFGDDKESALKEFNKLLSSQALPKS